jgi:predicted transcriptional regulator
MVKYLPENACEAIPNFLFTELEELARYEGIQKPDDVFHRACYLHSFVLEQQCLHGAKKVTIQYLPSRLEL